MTSKEKIIMHQINKIDKEETKNDYKIKRMVEDVRSSHNGSRTQGLNNALNEVKMDNETGMKQIREMMQKNKEKIREQMEIDYKIEREIINLEECDKKNPKYKQI